MPTPVSITSNTYNLVEFASEFHKTAAELNRHTGEWGVWKDGIRVNTKTTRDEAINEASRICAKEQ